jgi:hypothetical protein
MDKVFAGTRSFFPEDHAMVTKNLSIVSGRSLAKIVEQRAIKIGSNVFIVGKFKKKYTCRI